MRWHRALVICLSLVVTGRAAADVDSYYVHSLEWLVDASQSVQLATVVRERDATKTWTTRVKRVERVVKAVGDIPTPTAADLSAVVTAEGEHRVLLFLRSVPKKPTPEVMYVVYLNKHIVPAKPGERAEYYRSLLPEGFDLPRPNCLNKCIAIDRRGHVVTDPDKVVQRVEERVRQNPKRVRDTGFHAARGDELEDQSSVYFVFAPYDLDERARFLNDLGSPAGPDRASAARHLAHYADAEAIAALKGALTDDYHNNQFVRDTPDGPARCKEIYVVRRAAYESLQRLGVTVPRPALEHCP